MAATFFLTAGVVLPDASVSSFMSTWAAYVGMSRPHVDVVSSRDEAEKNSQGTKLEGSSSRTVLTTQSTNSAHPTYEGFDSSFFAGSRQGR